MAATAVLERFAGQLIALARNRLQDQFAAKEDPEDVLQSARTDNRHEEAFKLLPALASSQ